MINLRVLTALASILAAPATALAAPPIPVNVRIVNNTPYGIYTDTEAGSVHCLGPVIPGATVAPRQTADFTLGISCLGGDAPPGGQQVFVPALAGPEQRLTVTFTLNPAAPTRSAPGSAAGAGLTVTSRDMDWQPKFAGQLLADELSFTWVIDCSPAPCPAAN